MEGKRRILICVIVNAALYAAFVALDIMNALDVPIPNPSPSNIMKYASIVSCLLITLFAASANKAKAHVSPNLPRAARVQAVVFCVTLIADFVLLFTDYFVCGILIFLAAHLTALFRYKPRWVPFFAAAAGAFCIGSLFAGRSYHTDIQLLSYVLLCSAYAVLIIGLLVSVFFAEQPRVNTLLSRTGFVLFLCCDVNVFLSNFLSPQGAFYSAALILMWVFYLPAQTLLALSAVCWQESRGFLPRRFPRRSP